MMNSPLSYLREVFDLNVFVTASELHRHFARAASSNDSFRRAAVPVRLVLRDPEQVGVQAGPRERLPDLMVSRDFGRRLAAGPIKVPRADLRPRSLPLLGSRPPAERLAARAAGPAFEAGGRPEATPHHTIAGKAQPFWQREDGGCR